MKRAEDKRRAINEMEMMALAKTCDRHERDSPICNFPYHRCVAAADNPCCMVLPSVHYEYLENKVELNEFLISIW